MHSTKIKLLLNVFKCCLSVNLTNIPTKFLQKIEAACFNYSKKELSNFSVLNISLEDRRRYIYRETSGSKTSS